MRHECAICKEQFEERDMIRCAASPSHVQWLCWSCWKNAQGEACVVEMERKRKQRWEENRKK